MTLRIFDMAAKGMWAIRPAALQTILQIAARAPVDRDILAEWKAASEAARAEKLATFGIDAQQARLGVPMAMGSSVTMRGTIAVMPVMGPIFPHANMMTDFSGATSLDHLALEMTAIEDNPDVKSVVLYVDSPGGDVRGIAEFGARIAALNAVKPVVAYVAGNCCSAAYWLASQASRIAVNETGEVGSIGVVTTMLVQEEAGADGLMEYEIVSSNAPNKRPDPRTEEGRAVIKAELDAHESRFIDAVAKGRGVSAATVQADFGRGGVFVGSDGVAAGMADSVTTFEALIAEMSKPGQAAGQPGGVIAAAPSAIETRQPQVETETPDMTDKLNTAADTATLDAAVAAARTEATQAEAKRQADIDALSLPIVGVDAIVKAAKADVTATPEATAMKINHHLKANGGALKHLGARAEDDAIVEDIAAADPGAPAPADGDTSDEALKAAWDKSAKLRSEFTSFKAFAALRRAEASGRVNVLGARK